VRVQHQKSVGCDRTRAEEGGKEGKKKRGVAALDHCGWGRGKQNRRSRGATSMYWSTLIRWGGEDIANKGLKEGQQGAACEAGEKKKKKQKTHKMEGVNCSVLN